MNIHYGKKEIDRALYTSLDELSGESLEYKVMMSHIVPYDWYDVSDEDCPIFWLEPISKISDVKIAATRFQHGKFIQPDIKRLKIEITYNESIKSGKYFHDKEVTDNTGIKIRKRDNAILGTLFRRISSKNIKIKLLYKKPRGCIFREITPEQAFDLGYCIVWR